MTTPVERLALQVQLPGFPGTTLDPAVAALLDEGLGGLCLFGANTADGPDALARLTGAVHAASSSAIVTVDEEGGDVTRLHASTGSPVLGHAALGVVDDVDLTRRTAATIGAELASLGVTLDLAPVADVNSDPLNPVIGVRSFGAEPRAVARHVAAYVEGLRSAGVAACAKHFPGHGDTRDDSHVSLPRVDASVDQLRARELVPFAAAVGAGVDAVMTSHLLAAALDADLPATLSPAVLAVLRDELGFTGAVVSDALDMAGASQERGIPAAAVAALRAGCDVLLLGPDKDAALVREVQRAIVEAVRDGELAESRLRDAARRAGLLAGRRDARVAPAPDSEVQAAAARAALVVDGPIPDLSGALLARATTTPPIPVGDVPWGVPGLDVDPDDDRAVDRLLTEAAGRPVVLQVRDLARHPAVLALVDRVAPALVVEYGWPGAHVTGSQVTGARVVTHGASLPSAAAVAELLHERGWRA